MKRWRRKLWSLFSYLLLGFVLYVLFWYGLFFAQIMWDCVIWSLYPFLPELPSFNFEMPEFLVGCDDDSVKNV